ncbi:MAG TPA: hypothetical protein VGC71_13280 [Gaiellales bacterium]|jgi:hypothetical protein
MDEPASVSDRRISPVRYWLCVVALAVCAGVAAPALFLLGFWEMAPLVFVATWLAPKVARVPR